jgi:hypothetical protein
VNELEFNCLLELLEDDFDGDFVITRKGLLEYLKKAKWNAKVMEKLIPAPIVDWVRTNSPDPRDAYTTRINEHIVGIHSSEEAARNHAWKLEAYLGVHALKARGES